jgi:hypothetical protein
MRNSDVPLDHGAQRFWRTYPLKRLRRSYRQSTEELVSPHASAEPDDIDRLLSYGLGVNFSHDHVPGKKHLIVIPILPSYDL